MGISHFHCSIFSDVTSQSFLMLLPPDLILHNLCAKYRCACAPFQTAGSNATLPSFPMFGFVGCVVFSGFPIFVFLGFSDFRCSDFRTFRFSDCRIFGSLYFWIVRVSDCSDCSDCRTCRLSDFLIFQFFGLWIFGFLYFRIFGFPDLHIFRFSVFSDHFQNKCHFSGEFHSISGLVTFEHWSGASGRGRSPKITD